MREERASSAIQYHDRLAGSWSAGYRRSAHFTHRASDWQAIIDEYVLSGTKVLDIGCGSGDISRMAALRGAILTCVDGSSAMLDQARRSIESTAPNALFVEADVRKLPLNEGQFDVVLASSLLEYVDPLETALSEIRRVMRANGLFICSVPNPRSCYRRIEGVAVRCTGRPSYRRHVNRDIYRRDVPAMLGAYGFEVVKAQASGVPPLLGGGKLAAIAERHPLLATMIIYFARAV